MVQDQLLSFRYTSGIPAEIFNHFFEFFLERRRLTLCLRFGRECEEYYVRLLGINIQTQQILWKEESDSGVLGKGIGDGKLKTIFPDMMAVTDGHKNLFFSCPVKLLAADRMVMSMPKIVLVETIRKHQRFPFAGRPKILVGGEETIAQPEQEDFSSMKIKDISQEGFSFLMQEGAVQRQMQIGDIVEGNGSLTENHSLLGEIRYIQQLPGQKQVGVKLLGNPYELEEMCFKLHGIYYFVHFSQERPLAVPKAVNSRLKIK